MRLFKFLKVLVVSTMVLSTVDMTMKRTFAKTDDSQKLVEYVNTLFGTDDNKGSTSAGPTLPNGSINPSPETTSPFNGGYRQGNPIVGFGQLYAQGTGGTASYGQFLLSPQSGEKVETSQGNHASAVSQERGQANYYTANLDKYGIKAEVTPTEHAALYRFTYPENQDASLIIDASRKIGGSVAMKSGSVNIDKDNKMIIGGGTFGSNWNPSNWNMYFALSFDADIKEIGTWNHEGLKPDTLSLNFTSGKHLGAYVKFDTTKNQAVHAKIAISFDSVEKAKQFLNEEINDFDFDRIMSLGETKWNEVLGKVKLGNNVDETTKGQFYTALFQANIQPRNRVSDHGYWDDYYTLWDSWRTVFPFLQLTRPEMVADNIKSFAKRYNDNGMMSDAFIQGKEYLCGQGGNDIENVIADAYLKGVQLDGITWEEVYQVVKREAEEYRSKQYIENGYHYSGRSTNNGKNYSGRLKPSSATIGFAYNDYCVAMMAKGLGHEEDYQKYIARSKNWLNNWDENLESSDGYKGFIHKRAADGSFKEVDPSRSKGMDGTEYLWEGYNDDFYEAGIWEGSYSVPFDLPTLIEKMGGKYEYAERLDYALSKNYINFANEPGFQPIWTLASDEIQRPDLASKYVDKYLDLYTKDGYPGDEDNGAMSTMYLFMMSGFFPMSGTNNYYLHGTRVSEVTYRMGTGKDFVIKGVDIHGQPIQTGDGNIYVQSATWNGKPYNSSKLTWEQMEEGGTLVFVMGSEPSAWAKAADNENPSDVTNLAFDQSQMNDGKIILTWDAATDDTQVKEYNVYCATTENVELIQDNHIATTKDSSYTFEATSGVKYYRVEAVDYFEKKSINPPKIKVEILDDEKPVFGENSQITLDERYLNVGLVKFSWPAATDNMKVKEYRIYRGIQEKFDLDDSTFVTTTIDTSYVETKAKGTFYYKVYAVDIFGNVSDDALVLKVTNETGLTGISSNPNVNIAKNKAVTATGQHSTNEAPVYAVDGNTKTKWCVKDSESSAKPNFWLEIDLGDTYQINKWILKHASAGGEQAGYNTKDFKLQVKSGDEWLDIDSVVANIDGTTSRQTPMFEGQYIRLYISNPVQDGQAKTVRLYEFELYGNDNVHNYAGSIMKDVVNASVNGQANDREGAYSAFDFNSSTKWSCHVTAATNGVFWLQMELPQDYSVYGFELLSAGNDESVSKPEYITKNFTIQVEKDGEWAEVLDIMNNAQNFYHGEFDEKITGSRFRLLITPDDLTNQANNARVLEFHLLGEKITDKSQLQSLYDEYIKNVSLYTLNSWQAFIDTQILEKVKTVLDDKTAIQSEVNAVLSQLQEAVKVLVKCGDKTALGIAIEMAKNADLENVVPAVVKEFNEALANARTVYNNVNATQADVDNAFNRLANVMQMLEFYQGDKTALQKMVNQIADLTASDYIESSWNAMLPVLDKANGVLGNENAMQEEVDEAYTELIKAFVNLRLKPNKDLLNDLINKANGLKEAKYTAASWKVMNEALNNAKAVLDNPEATKQEVFNAKEALTKAMAGLVEKPAADNNVNTVKPGDTTVSVKTGDEIDIVYLHVGLAATSIIMAANKKRKKNKIID